MSCLYLQGDYSTQKLYVCCRVHSLLHVGAGEFCDFEIMFMMCFVSFVMDVKQCDVHKRVLADLVANIEKLVLGLENLWQVYDLRFTNLAVKTMPYE